MSQSINYCCPLCKGNLNFSGEKYSCSICKKTYPVVMGIPDFRVFPDPYIDFEDDYKKARSLATQSERLDFKELLKYYWDTTPDTPSDLVKRYMKHAILLIERGNQNLKDIESITTSNHNMSFNSALEIGCGTGGFLISLSAKFQQVIGIDIAFRWLILARKRLDEFSLKIQLVCCCAEYLPFNRDNFDLVVAESVLEHVNDQKATLRQCHHVLNNDGVLFIITPNRYTILSEPHVNAWGVGFLPRKWMKSYVKMVRGISYENIHVLSFFEMKRLLKESLFNRYKFYFPSITKEIVQKFRTFERIQFAIYRVVNRLAVLRPLLYIFSPVFHIICSPKKSI